MASYKITAGRHIGTCPTTGKRQYESRKHARKARQMAGHTHGNAYLCDHCAYWHIGRRRSSATRAEYRGDTTGMIHTDHVCAELNISYHVLNQALQHLEVEPVNHHIPEHVFEQLRKLSERKE